MRTEAVAPGGEGLRAVVAGVVVVVLVAAVLIAVWRVHPGADDAPRASLAGVRSFESAPPRPLAAGEVYVRTEVLSSGDLMVTHWIESRQQLDSVRLSPPEVAATKRVTAEEVRVVVDDAVVQGPGRISELTAPYHFQVASSVQISYRLTGALEFSGSVRGRALARPTALDVITYEQATQHVTQTVIGPRVLALACSPPGPTPPVPCGTRVSDGQWTVELPGRRALDRVIAALTIY